MRAFSVDDVAQTTDGVPGSSASPVVSLPRPAIQGRGGILIVGAQTDLSPPEQWHMPARAGLVVGGNLLAIMVRPDLEQDEQSWQLQASSGTPFWVWRVEEWTNVSFAAPLGASFTNNTTPGLTSISTGTTDAWDSSAYAVGIAAVLMLGNASGAAFPTISSWTNGFVEDVAPVVQGTGSTANDLKLWIARKYGQAGDAGAWETTATFSGTVTGKTPMAALAVFRAENMVVDLP